MIYAKQSYMESPVSASATSPYGPPSTDSGTEERTAVRISPTALAGLLLVAACQLSTPPQTQTARLPEERPSGGERPVVRLSSEMTTSSEVPGRSVRGVVLSAETGKPLSNALISVYAKDTGELGRTASDSSGLFTLSDLPARAAILRAEFIGTRAREFALDLENPSGYAVRFALAETPVCLCVTLKDPRAVTVLARDVVTGKAPTAVTTLRLRDGAFEDVVAATPTPGDSLLVLRSSSWRRGTYVLKVSADGYEPWVQDSVIVDSGGCCGNLQPQVVSAWLLPR